MKSTKLQLAVVAVALAASAACFLLRGPPPDVFFGEAVFHADLTEVHKCLTWGVNLNRPGCLDTPSWRESTHPVLWAARSDQRELVELLIARGADVTVAGGRGVTTLHHAASLGWREVAEELIARGADVNAVDHSGYTPLTNAVRGGCGGFIEVLFASGPGTAWRDFGDGSTMVPAAEKDRVEIVRLLLEHGATVNRRRNDFAVSELHLAAYNGRTEIVRLLVTVGKAEIGLANLNGATALHLAASQAHADTVKALATYGADIRAADRQGRTVLHYAAAGGSCEAVEELLSRGADADVNARDQDGVTPYALAKAKGHSGVLALFHARGVKQ